MSTAMIAATRLQTLLKNKGDGVLDLDSSAKALLCQEFNDFPEECRVLITVLETGLIKPLRESDSRDRAHVLQSTANQREEQTGMHPEWSRWAIRTWLSAISDQCRVRGQPHFSPAQLRPADRLDGDDGRLPGCRHQILRPFDLTPCGILRSGNI